MILSFLCHMYSKPKLTLEQLEYLNRLDMFIDVYEEREQNEF